MKKNRPFGNVSLPKSKPRYLLFYGCTMERRNNSEFLSFRISNFQNSDNMSLLFAFTFRVFHGQGVKKSYIDKLKPIKAKNQALV